MKKPIITPPYIVASPDSWMNADAEQTQGQFSDSEVKRGMRRLMVIGGVSMVIGAAWAGIAYDVKKQETGKRMGVGAIIGITAVVALLSGTIGVMMFGGTYQREEQKS